MRVNVYSEEMTDKIEIISKEIEGHTFTGLRLYLELPATVNGQQYQGPFMHRPGDDDSSAVTFWGKQDLRKVLRKALAMLDDHYERRHDWQPIYAGADVESCTRCSLQRRSDGQFRRSSAAYWVEGAVPLCGVHEAAPAAIGVNVIEHAPPGPVLLTASQREEVRRALAKVPK